MSLIQKLTWMFTDANGIVGSGLIKVNSKTGVVVGMSGTYEGKKITLSGINDHAHGAINGTNYSYHPNTPAPGLNTLQNVPNTTGANYTYDNVYNTTANPGTGVDVNGILVSTGSGKTKTYYDISLDGAGATQVDFFSIAKDGSYVSDNGAFTTSAPISPAVTKFTQSSAVFGASGQGAITGSSGPTTPSNTPLTLVASQAA